VILILTYHKVIRSSNSESDFYTITAEKFTRQLELLAKSNLRPLAPEALLTPQPDSTPCYALTFDDGTEDHQQIVLPLLQKHNCRGIFFVPTAKISCPGYLSPEGVRQLSRAGQSIGLHSHEHRRMDRFTEEDLRVQFELSQNTLGELTGVRPVLFAPPGGYINSCVRRLAAEAGVRVIRTMRWGYNRKPNLTDLECIPINRYIDEKEFGRILKFERKNGLYSAKQVARTILPARVYAALRDSFSSRLERS
jgi:peptidoglycan/xylan/chitin deacetylase (PgdA/CDA1 family)